MGDIDMVITYLHNDNTLNSFLPQSFFPHGLKCNRSVIFMFCAFI